MKPLFWSLIQFRLKTDFCFVYIGVRVFLSHSRWLEIPVRTYQIRPLGPNNNAANVNAIYALFVISHSLCALLNFKITWINTIDVLNEMQAAQQREKKTHQQN